MGGPFDYGSLIRNGQSLVPDFQQQQAQQQELQLRSQQQQMQQSVLQAKTMEAQREAERQEAYQSELGQYLLKPSAEGLARLSMKFPEASEGLKRSFDMLQPDMKMAALRGVNAVGTRLANGDIKGALAKVEERIAASRNSGQEPNEDDVEIAELLSSGDAEDINIAKGLVAGLAHAVGGDEGKSLAERMFPKQEIVDGRLVVGRDGSGQVSVVGQLPGQTVVIPDGGELRPYATPGVPVLGAGGTSAMPTVQQSADPAPQASGGQQASGEVNIVAPPGARQTSGFRSPEKNASVGGVPNSYHTRKDARGNPMARDYVPAQGQSMGQLAAELRRLNPGMDVINEGDHVHVEPGSGGRRMASSTGGIPTVRSLQEARRLAPGTTFRTPDGRLKVR